jgi:sensor histidine kinase YesM
MIYINSFFLKNILILLLLISTTNWAQKPYAIELNDSKNFPSNTVFNIFNDSQGYIWHSTPKGLYKYDGTRFQVFKANFQSSVSGTDIREDKYNRIWYQNFDGFLYYVKDNQLNKINQNSPIGYIPSGITDDYLFIVQKNGVDVFDLQSLKLIKTIELSLGVNEHTTVLNNNFYLIADNIIYRIDPDLKVTQSDYFVSKKLHVKYIYPTSNSLYVISKLNEHEKIYFFDENLKFERSFKIPKINYIQGSDFIDSIIWIHTPNGSYAYNINGDALYSDPILQDCSISKLIKDYRNNFWFSSINKGVQVVPNLNNHLISKHSSIFKTLFKFKDGFLLGSNVGELVQTDKNFENKIVIHKIKENLPTSLVYYDSLANTLFFSNKGFNIVQNRDFKTLNNYDIALKDIVKIDEKYYAFAASNICGLFKNPKISNQIKSNWDSVFFNNKTPNYNEIALLINNTRGKSVLYNKYDSTIYYATNAGVFSYNKKGLNEIKNNGKSFYATKLINLNNKIFALNAKGNMYEITTTGDFVNMTKLLKIPNEEIQLVKELEDSLLFVCSNYIYTFDGESLKQINFSSNMHNIYDAYLDKDTLIILTDEGIISIQLKSIESTEKHLFYIEKVTVNHKIINWKTYINLKYNENNVKIYFSLLDYVFNNSVLEYRINEGNWINISKSVRTLDFPSLSAGSYLVEFRVNNQIQTQKISFIISSPFWLTWWFYAIFTLLIIALVFIYFRWKSQIMAKKIDLLNEKIALEKDLRNSMLSTIKSQMNPHFFYNALNTIQAYIFKNDKLNANNYLAKFSKLTRIILEMSEKDTILLSDEINAIKLYLDLEQMRFSNDFIYQINVSKDIKVDTTEFPPMLLQPYVENAIKHGLLHLNKEKVLIISIISEGNNLIISIDDNGIGRVKSNEINKQKNKGHQSFATQAIDKRLEILNKGRVNKISVEYVDKYNNGIPTGTKVILIIPIISSDE